MAPKVAVLGAGAMGSVAAKLIARHKDEVDLLIVDVDLQRAQAVVADIGTGEARAFDAKSDELTRVLREVQSVAACLPYRLNIPVMEAALKARCHYADLGGLFHTTLKQMEYDQRFRQAGAAAVLGIGSAPGLTNILGKYGADQLDTVVSIDMVDGAIEEGGGGFGVPYSVETVFDEFTLPAMVFEDGEMKEVPAASGVIMWDFPEPLGTLPAMYTLHSEPATMPQSVPGVRDVRWRLALPTAVHEGFAFLTEIGMVSNEPVDTPNGRVTPREVAAAVLDRMPVHEGPPRDVEYLDVRVAGTKDGKPAKWRGLAKLTPPPEGMSAGAFGTALPIALTARWMAVGKVSPGVYPAELAHDNAEFIAELEREGVEFTFSLEVG
jgi:saccharopine dehydrogenase (NAD+, L-lysine-forming)